MVKESPRKCSHCGQNGHNSRTCYGKTSLKLFGVTIDVSDKRKVEEDDFIRKTQSMGNLAACNGEQNASVVVDAGYASDQPGTDQKTQERKKGVPWSVGEHKAFLEGLKKHGKGDWRAISKNFVPTRTPTQVASHAQKHFIRLNNGAEKKKRRSSLFDMSFKDTATPPSPPPPAPPEPPRRPPQFPQRVDNSSVGSSNNTEDIRGQARISPNAGSLMESPSVLPVPAGYALPNFGPIPYYQMMGASSNGQNFPGSDVYPTISFIPVMNIPNRGSICLPNSGLAKYPLKLH